MSAVNHARPKYFSKLEDCVQGIIDQVGHKVVVAAPLGIGKPNSLLNALYHRAKSDSSLSLILITALNLNRPDWSSDLERRLIEPMRERIWGDYEDLDYETDLKKDQLPDNVEVVQFFFKPGDCLQCCYSQQNYLCSNYTHAVRDGVLQGVNVLVQMVSCKEIQGRDYFSMGSSPDTHLEAGKAFRDRIAQGHKLAVVAQINQNMPFMYGEACVDPDFYDLVLDNRKLDFQMFNAPKESVALTDWSIGLQASALVQDGGTLQIGIGSLGDAAVSALLLRHKDNEVYQSIIQDMQLFERYGQLLEQEGGTNTFEQGLHGSSEMLVDGMLELYKADVIKRKVYEHENLQGLLNQGLIQEEIGQDTLQVLMDNLVIHPRLTERDCDFLVHFGIFREDVQYNQGLLQCQGQVLSNDLEDKVNYQRVLKNCLGTKLKQGIAINASFFLGPREFYEYLYAMPEEQLKEINMRGVNFVNQLYGGERIKTLQRTKGRFINAALMVRLTGAVISHTLDNCRVISGPGGQYNFVSMAHALPDARSIIMLRSTRSSSKGVSSNIVWEYGATTIPRHLRDIVITEYGIADLRGLRDKEIISALLSVTDSRFQDQLLRKAQKSGKMPKHYRIPDQCRQNTPERIQKELQLYRDQGYLPAFPFGAPYTQEEIVLGQSLRSMAGKSKRQKVTMLPGLLKNSLSQTPEKARPYLERMQLAEPSSFRERLQQKIVLHALREAGRA